MENLSSENVVDSQSKPTSEYRSKRSDDGLRLEDECIFVFSEYRSKRSDDGLRLEDECIFVFLLLFRVLLGFFAVNKSSVL